MKRFNVSVNGRAYDVSVEELGAAAPAPVAVAPAAAPVASAPAAPAPAAPAAPVAVPVGAATTIESPMPGTILDIKVGVGQSVEVNEPLVILEAMKMENDIVTPAAGTVAAIHVNKGDVVNTGTLLISIA